MDDFNPQFPTFHLEDKVVLEEEGNVKPLIIFQYQRKGKKGIAHVSGNIALSSNTNMMGDHSQLGRGRIHVRAGNQGRVAFILVISSRE